LSSDEQILKNLKQKVQGFVKQHFFGHLRMEVGCGDRGISIDLLDFDWHLSLESSRN